MSLGGTELLAVLLVGIVVAVAIASMLWVRRRRRVPPGPSASRAAFARAFEEELERARRYERPLALVRIGPTDERPKTHEMGSPLPEPPRRSDRVFVIGRWVYVLAPETDLEASRGLVQRLRGSAELDARPPSRVACFPAHGITSGALLAWLDDEVQQGADPSPAGPRVR